jgi:hypothetical protein
MARKFRIGNRRSYSPRRVAYQMTNGRRFYEKRGPNQGAYDTKFPYVQNYYWVDGYTEID